MTNEKRDSMMVKVRGLIAKADDPTVSPEEADLFRAKADELMAKYTISEFELKAGRTTAGREPITRWVDISYYWTHEYGPWVFTMMNRVYKHCRCHVVYWEIQSDYDREFRKTTHRIAVCGLEVDLDYADMLFTSLMLDYSNGLEPHPMPGEPMILALVRMKEAGMKWERIGNLLIEAGIADFDEYTRNVGVRFTKLYSDYCREHGRPQLKTSPKVYQRSFTEGYVSRIRERLYDIQQRTREAYDADLKSSDVDRAFSVVLADIDTVVAAYVGKTFGHSKPKPSTTTSSKGSGRTRSLAYDRAAAEDGRDRASRAKIGVQGEVTGNRSSLPRGQ